MTSIENSVENALKNSLENAMNKQCGPILVIEDDTALRETLQDVLECEGYLVLTATHGRHGLDLLADTSIKKPCVILLDMMMPVMNGREFLDKIITDPILCLIPVLIVSSIIDEISTLGSVGVIRKPADLDLILSKVAQYC